MIKSTGIEKLVEKCRGGDVKACDELRRYREWLEKRLDRREGIVGSSLIGLFITVPLYTIPQVFHIPILFKIFIAIYAVLAIILVAYYISCLILERHIKKLYEILGDPIMPWRIDPGLTAMLICGLALAILGIYLCITSLT